jgi:hypothetical protein
MIAVVLSYTFITDPAVRGLEFVGWFGYANTVTA